MSTLILRQLKIEQISFNFLKKLFQKPIPSKGGLININSRCFCINLSQSSSSNSNLSYKSLISSLVSWKPPPCDDNPISRKRLILKERSKDNQSKLLQISRNQILNIKDLKNASPCLTSVTGSDGFNYGTALCDLSATIPAQFLAYNSQQTINENFFQNILEKALHRRLSLSNDSKCPIYLEGNYEKIENFANLNYETNLDNKVFRVVNDISDGLPGILLDKFGPYLTLKFQTLASISIAEPILKAINTKFDFLGIFINFPKCEPAYKSQQATRAPLKCLPSTINILEDGFVYILDTGNENVLGNFIINRHMRSTIMNYCYGSHILDLSIKSGGCSFKCLKAGNAKHTTFITDDNTFYNFAKDLAILNQITNTVDIIHTNLTLWISQNTTLFDLIIFDYKPETSIPLNYDKLNELQDVLQLLNTNGFLLITYCDQFRPEDMLLHLKTASAKIFKNIILCEESGPTTDVPSLLFDRSSSSSFDFLWMIVQCRSYN